MFKKQKILYEVKVKAVEDYLSGKISIQEIVNQLQFLDFQSKDGFVNTRLLEQFELFSINFIHSISILSSINITLSINICEKLIHKSN